MLKINGVDIAAMPSAFQCMPFDLDAEEGTGRTSLGDGYRTRVAVKRQIEMGWGMLTNAEISSILQAMSGEYFTFSYPDPMSGTTETKTFSVGNRPAPFAIKKGNEIYWSGLKVTLTER